MSHPLSKEMIEALERGSSSEEERKSNLQIYKEFYFKNELNKLIRLAHEHNCVITIDNVPLQPLRTGNTEMVPHVRAARGSY